MAISSPISNPIKTANDHLIGSSSLCSAYAGSDTNCLIVAANGKGGEILIRDTVTPANSGLFNINVKIPHSVSQMFLDKDGIYKWNATNYVHYSSDLTNWGVINSPVTTATTVEDNDAANYELIVSNAATVVAGQSMLYTAVLGKDSIPKTTRFCLVRFSGASVDTMFDTSTGEIGVIDTGSAVSEYSVTENSDGDWDVRIVFAPNTTSVSVHIYPAIGSGSSLTSGNWDTSTTGSIEIKRQSFRPYPCPEYHIETTSAAIYHQCEGFDGNGNVRGFSWWGSRTNSLPISTDMTDANWSNSAYSTVVYDEDGIDGVANSAATLTDTSDAGYGTLNDNVAIANDSATHVVQAKFKKTIGAATFPGFGSYISTGGTAVDGRYTLNTDTGVATAYSANTGTSTATVEDFGDWWLLSVADANNSTGNTRQYVYFYPAVNTDGLGVWDTSVTGSCIVCDPMIVLNQTHAGPYIPTYGSTVTRGSPNNELAASGNFNIPASFTLFADVEIPENVYGWFVQISDDSANNRALIYQDASSLVRALSNDAGVAQFNTSGVNASNTQIRTAARIAANDFIKSVDGATYGADVSGTVPSVFDIAHFGHYHTQAFCLDGYFLAGGMVEEETDAELNARTA